MVFMFNTDSGKEDRRSILGEGVSCREGVLRLRLSIVNNMLCETKVSDHYPAFLVSGVSLKFCLIKN